MGCQRYRLGEDVHIELLFHDDAGTVPGQAFVSPYSFSIDLTNFTGRLIVTSDRLEAFSDPSHPLGASSSVENSEQKGEDTKQCTDKSEPASRNEVSGTNEEQSHLDSQSPPSAPVTGSQDAASPSEDSSAARRWETLSGVVRPPNNHQTAPVHSEESGSSCSVDDLPTADDDQAPTIEDEHAHIIPSSADEGGDPVLDQGSQHGSSSSALVAASSSQDGAFFHEATKGDSSSQPEKQQAGNERFRHLVKKVIHSKEFVMEEKEGSSPYLNWGNLVHIAAVKRRVPRRVPKRRMQAKTGLDTEPPPTRLHELCAEPSVTLDKLQTALEESLEAASVRDQRGRLPLHILGDNDALVENQYGKEVATTFGWTLMQAYPEGITSVDSRGCMPFVALIDDWVRCTYETYRRSKEAAMAEKGITLMDRVRQGMETGAGNVSRGFAQSVTRGSLGHGSNDEAQTLQMSTETPALEVSPDHRANIIDFSERAHPPVEMWDEVEWCFSMLSMAMDELGGKNGGLYKQKHHSLLDHHTKDLNARTVLATHVVAVVPTILKTILLLEEDGAEARKRILKMSIIRRILLCPESVGPWLTSMLRRKGGVVSRRAVDYLEAVSKTTSEDYVGGFRSVLSGDEKEFFEARANVFAEVEELEGVIACLVALDEKETERAAATPVVWSIMSKNLSRPFVVGLVLIDFVLHITLMLAFRNDVSFKVEDERNVIGSVPTKLVILICSHYFIRKVVEGISLFKLSVTVFRRYFTNIWTLFDFVSIILTLVAVVWNDKHPNEFRQGFNSAVLGLLWIKVLGFLKVVNKDMSMFILALMQILRDLRYFALVMAVIIFMFGDMMRIAVSTKDNGEYCIQGEESGDLSGPIQDFCSSNQIDSFLRVYALLLGDFELDDWRDTAGLTVLFVIFTLIGMIILLNVLIAVVSDSYEKAKIQGRLLFGRARVTFVAQNQALESFLNPGGIPVEWLKQMGSNPRNLFGFAIRIFRYLVLCAILATAFVAELYLVARAYHFIKHGTQFLTLIAVAFLSVILTTALWVVITLLLKGVLRDHMPLCLVRIFDLFDKCSSFCVKSVASWLFGLQKHTKVGGTETARGQDDEEEWTGRLTYLENVFEKSLAQTKEDLTNEITAVEKRLYEHHVMLTNPEGSKSSADEAEHLKSVD